MAHGDESEFEFVLGKHAEANVQSERGYLLKGLTCTRQVWLLHRLLNMTLHHEDAGLQLKEVGTIVSRVASNVYGKEIVTNFVREHFHELREL